MDDLLQQRRHRLQLLSLTYLCATAVFVLALVAACGRGSSNDPVLRGAINSERQVIYPGYIANPKSVRRTSSGDFLLALSLTTAMAVMTDSQGILKWKYAEPNRGGLGFVVESEFFDSVQLKNGKILFCGKKLREFRREAGFIMVFDSSGNKLDEKTMIPNGDTRYVAGSFLHCFRWNDGVALVGVAQHESEGSLGWIVKLDQDGTKEWEKFGKTFFGQQAVPLQDGGIAVAAFGSKAYIGRLDMSGEVTAHREYPSVGGALLDSTVPTNTTSVLLYSDGSGPWLYSLDKKLNELRTPIKLHQDIDVTMGVGYVLADGSLALFGRGLGDAAVRGVFTKEGKVRGLVSFPKPSFTIAGAAPVDENEFVSLRTTDNGNDPNGTLRLAWDSFR